MEEGSKCKNTHLLDVLISSSYCSSSKSRLDRWVVTGEETGSGYIRSRSSRDEARPRL